VRLFGSTNINQIIVQVSDGSQMDATSSAIESLLRTRHRLSSSQADDFTIRNNNDIISRVSSVSSTMTMLLGGVAAVSLVVGGIGIMNIMLVSVTERTREIGIRKAVGARRRDILSQFLVEAVVVSLLGGAIGIGFGSGVSAIISQIPFGSQTLQTQVAPDSIALAFCVSAAIGLFFGIYPATRASRLNPIEALRYE
jgi:putative ABC transport system permease protein